MIRFIKEYLLWHYGAAPREFFALWKNFLWFGYHFFSIPLLVSTFAAPVYRLQEKSSGSFDPGRILGDFVVTTLMRIVGMILRTIVLALGTVFEAILALLAVPALALWLLLPILSPLLATIGILIATL